MSSSPDLSCEELRRLYLDQGLSQAAIAARIGCSPTTISNRLRRCGIVTRAGRFSGQPLERGLLERLYSDEALPLAVIANRFGVSVGTIHNWRRAYGIPTRARIGPREQPRGEQIELTKPE